LKQDSFDTLKFNQMKLQSPLTLLATSALLVFAGCEKSNINPIGWSVGSTPGFEGKIGEKNIFYQEGQGFESGTSADKSVSQLGSKNAAYESWVSSLNVPNEGIQITKGQLYYNGDNPDESQFRNFVVSSTNPYAPARSKDGIIVSYTDEKGVKWSSNAGSADQTGSSFRIVNSREETYFDDLYIKAYIQFSCKVYSSDGEVKTISNAKFVGHFNR
jgi:hypothetical protein